MRGYAFAGFCAVVLIVAGLAPVHCGKKMDLDEVKDMLKPMSKSCKGKTGVSDDLVKGTLTGNFPRERPLMCYIKCLAVMLKVMNKQGQITMGNVEKQVNLLIKEDLAARIIVVVKSCFKKVQAVDDPCEYAFILMECAYQEDSTLYFLPT